MKEIKEKQLELQIDKRIFNDFYFPYLTDYSHRFEVHKGSAGSGKSYFITQKLVLKALQSKRKVLVMRKVGASIKDSTWQLFIDVLQQFQMYDKSKVNKSDFTITLPNDSVFLFKGLDDPEKIKSIAGITDIFIEESTEFTLDDITQLNLRLRAKVKDCQIFYAFNPVSKNNYCYSYFKFDAENQTQPIREYENTIIFCTTYKQNKFLSADYIKTLEDMKESNYIYYQIYCMGLFCSLDKLIFTNWTSENFNINDIKTNKELNFLYSGDFGYSNDPTAFICSAVDEKNKIWYVFDEHFEKGMLNTDIANMIKNKGLQKEIIIFDSAEPKSIEEIRRLGINRARPSKKGKGSILQGIQKLQQYRIVIHSSCKNLIEEFSNYSWKKNKDGEYENIPLDNGYCHGVDALRYACILLKVKPKIIKIRL